MMYTRRYFRSKTNNIIDAIIIIVLALFLVIQLYPLYFILIASISNPVLVSLNKVSIIPREITFEGYRIVLINKEVYTGFLNSLFYASAGTFINLFFTLTCAFCMARKPEIKGKGIIMIFFVFTMYFNGGLIPYYILIKNLNLIDSRLVMILPGVLNIFNRIIVRTYYQTTIPHSLYESAHIDGYNDLRMFLHITLPLSKPVIAVMALFYAVGHWNSYFPAMIFLQSPEKQPLQLVLRNILILNQMLKNLDYSNLTPEEIMDLTRRQRLAESIKYAIIYISSLPVLIAYPFAQKYFVRGIMIGAIKG